MDPVEPELAPNHVELVDERLDYPERIVIGQVGLATADLVVEKDLPAPDFRECLERLEIEEVERLLAAAPELDVFEAAAFGRTDRLRELLDEDPTLANAFGDDGFHPLGLASFFGHVDAARLLLDRGADVNALSTNENVQTAAIHAAAAAQGKDEATRYELVKLALEYGADPNLPQGGGFRAIDAARQNGDSRVEQLLIEHDAEG